MPLPPSRIIVSSNSGFVKSTTDAMKKKIDDEKLLQAKIKLRQQSATNAAAELGVTPDFKEAVVSDLAIGATQRVQNLTDEIAVRQVADEAVEARTDLDTIDERKEKLKTGFGEAFKEDDLGVPAPVVRLPGEAVDSTLDPMERRKIQLEQTLEKRGVYFVRAGVNTPTADRIQMLTKLIEKNGGIKTSETPFADGIKFLTAYGQAAAMVTGVGAVPKAVAGNVSKKAALRLLAVGDAQDVQRELVEPGAALTTYLMSYMNTALDTVTPDYLDKINALAPDTLDYFFKGYNGEAQVFAKEFEKQLEEKGPGDFLQTPSKWAMTTAYNNSDIPSGAKITTEILVGLDGLLYGGAKGQLKLGQKLLTAGGPDLAMKTTVGSIRAAQKTGKAVFNPAVGRYMASGNYAEALDTVGKALLPAAKTTVRELYGLPTFKRGWKFWKERHPTEMVANLFNPTTPTEQRIRPLLNQMLVDLELKLEGPTNDTIKMSHKQRFDRLVTNKAGQERIVTGQLTDIANKLDAAEFHSLEDRFNEIEKLLVNDIIKTGHGAGEFIAMKQMLNDLPALTAATDMRFDTSYQKMMSKIAPRMDMLRMTANRFGIDFHHTSSKVAMFTEGISREVNKSAYLLNKTHRDTLEQMSKRTYKVKPTEDPTKNFHEVAQGNVDNWVAAGEISQSEGELYKLMMAMEGGAGKYELPQLTQRAFGEVVAPLEDVHGFEIALGAYRGPDVIEGTQLARYYLPHLFKFNDDVLDDGGLLLPETIEKIFGSKRFFEKDRTFIDIAQAVNAAAKNGVVLRFSDEIKSPVDAVVARMTAHTRLMSDKFLEDQLSAMKAKAKQIGGTEGAVASKRIDKEIKEFRKVLSGGDQGGGVTKVLSAVLAPFRQVKLNADAGVLGVQNLGSIGYLLANPKSTVKMWGTAFRHTATDKGYKEWMVMNHDRIADASRWGVRFGGELLQRELGGTWIEKLPTLRKGGPIGVRPGLAEATGEILPKRLTTTGRLYNPLQYLNDAQFSRYMSVLKLEAYEMSREMLDKHSQVNMAMRALHAPGGELGKRGDRFQGIDVASNLSPGEAKYAAANHVNDVFGGVGNMRALQPAYFRRLLQLPMMTPQFTQSALAIALRGTAGGVMNPEAALMRGFWIRMLAVTGGIASVAQYMVDGTEANITDPNKPNFFTVTDGDKAVIVDGRFNGLAKTFFFSPLDDAINLVQGEAPMGRWGLPDITEFQTYQRMSRWVGGRVHSVISATQQVKNQTDFFGQNRWTTEDPPSDIDKLLAWGEVAALPISLAQMREDTEDGAKIQDFWLGWFFGAPEYPLDRTRETAKKKLIESLAIEIGKNYSGQYDEVTATQIAFDTVHVRKPQFGGVKRSVVLDTDGNRLDVDWNRVNDSVAERMGWYETMPDGSLRPNRLLAAGLGEYDSKTPKEQENIDKVLVDASWKWREDVKRAFITNTTDIEANMGPGGQYPTLDSAIRAHQKLSTIRSTELGLITKLTEQAFEALKDPRVEPTVKQGAFETIRSAIDGAVHTDGSTDYWERSRIMDELEKWGPELVDEFFESDANSGDVDLTRKIRALNTIASTYYEIPIDIIDNKADYMIWRSYDLSQNPRDVERETRLHLTNAEWLKGRKLDRQVELARREAIRSDVDAQYIDMALFFLEGRRPTTVGGRAYIRGLSTTQAPIAAFEAIDPTILEDIVASIEGGTSGDAPQSLRGTAGPEVIENQIPQEGLTTP